jgi:translation initiation factor IF-2
VARSRSGTRGRRGPRKPQNRAPQGAVATIQTAESVDRGAIEIPSSITVKELAELLGVNPADVIRELIKSGIFANINQLVDRDTASLVAEELGYAVAEPAAATAVATDGNGVETPVVAPATKEVLYEEDEASKLISRAPIVTVMGHVDHGKTSLLDAIRTTEVAAGERGGITQHIGASEVTVGERRIVFLDTPGHEAFTAMRARGAKVTDIAVLVVAADDGVMPQTIEAIDHAKAAKVPIVIALNKIDKPDANPDRVKTELSEHGIVIEEYGGEVPLVPVSAKQRTGIDDLLETILLQSDINVDPKANPKRAAVGTVIEAELDKGRGAVATVIVQTGTLRVGDVAVVGDTYGRIRALENSRGERVAKAGPASAVVVLGLSEVPAAGDILRAVPDEKTARVMVERRRTEAAGRSDGNGRATLEDLYRQIQAGQTKELRIVIKADVQGSLGAITHALEQVATDDVKINILLQATGDITDNDILLATASNAIVVGFNVRLDPTARRAAEAEGVDVRLYDIIYKLTEDIQAALAGMLEPEVIEVVEGRAEIRQIFRVGKSTVIAGSYVTEGRIVRGGARVYRGGKVVTTDRIESLRRFRDDVREVAAGFECGIGLAGYNDLVEGDIVECFTQQTVSRAASA